MNVSNIRKETSWHSLLGCHIYGTCIAISVPGVILLQMQMMYLHFLWTFLFPWFTKETWDRRNTNITSCTSFAGLSWSQSHPNHTLHSQHWEMNLSKINRHSQNEHCGTTISPLCEDISKCQSIWGEHSIHSGGRHFAWRLEGGWQSRI